jgi:hypothetical protein
MVDNNEIECPINKKEEQNNCGKNKLGGNKIHIFIVYNIINNQ